MKRRRAIGILLAATLLPPLSATAENSTSAGGFTVHHNAFTSDTLTPPLAKAYGIQRSKYRGLLNVSVIKEKAGTTGTSVPAQVDARIMKLTGQSARLAMREINQGGKAIYYLGEFPVQDGQIINFAIEVVPKGGEAISIRMDQQFFTD